ncbi:MAG: GNAT family N-acetyltransferase [Thermoplasmata archaeon]|nr:GNAT family N-acetyltransferase [Thermoplasmata archaeon]
MARGAFVGTTLAGMILLENLVPEVGYLYYLFVGTAHRRTGVGSALLDDALHRFQRDGVTVVYAVAEEGNEASIGLFESRGFRTVERRELGWKDGGLGAWGLRSRMRIIGGEVLLGRRLPTSPAPRAARPKPGTPGVSARSRPVARG